MNIKVLSNQPMDVSRPAIGLVSRHLLIVLLAAIAGGCMSTLSRTPPSVSSIKPVSPVEQDPLTLLMMAEFALQKGDLQEAARDYNQAALLSADPAVSEQAVHLAMAVQNWELAQAASIRWQQLAPQAPGLHQARAWIALEQGHTEEAFVALSELVAEPEGTPENESWRLLAQVLLGAKDRNTAALLLSRLITPGRLGVRESAWVMASELAFKLGDKALARDLAAQSVQRFHGGESYAWTARMALDAGDKVSARAAYVQALKYEPGNVRVRIEYALLLAESADNRAAADVLAKGPQNDVTYAARAAYAVRSNDKSMFAAIYKDIHNDRSARSGKRIFLLGQLAELLDKSDEALAWYQAVPNESEQWSDAQTRKAIVLDQQGKTDQALALLHELEISMADDAKTLGEIYLLEAELFVRHDRYRDALTTYSRALTALPDDTRLLYARALLAIDHGDLPQGEKDLRHVLTLKPDDVGALNALGYTLADRTDRQDEALVLIEKALQLKPEDAAVIDSLGWVQYRLGKLDEAIMQLRRAYKKQVDAEIAAHLGEVLWVKGERDEARRIWEQGRKKNAKNKVLLETIKRLSSS